MCFYSIAQPHIQNTVPEEGHATSILPGRLEVGNMRNKNEMAKTVETVKRSGFGGSLKRGWDEWAGPRGFQGNETFPQLP